MGELRLPLSYLLSVLWAKRNRLSRGGVAMLFSGGEVMFNDVMAVGGLVRNWRTPLGE